MAKQAGSEWQYFDDFEYQFSQLADDEQLALMQPNTVKQDDGLGFDELIASMLSGEMKQQAMEKNNAI